MVSKQTNRDSLIEGTTGKPFKNTRNGYWYVIVDGKIQSLHRYLAKKHAPNPGNLRDVNHKDGNKDNNSLDNLEWCSRSYNIKHAYTNGLRTPAFLGKFGKEHKSSKPVVGICVKSGARVEFEAGRAALAAGFNNCRISDCVHGKRRSHKGYLWYFADDPRLSNHI